MRTVKNFHLKRLKRLVNKRPGEEDVQGRDSLFHGLRQDSQVDRNELVQFGQIIYKLELL